MEDSNIKKKQEKNGQKKNNLRKLLKKKRLFPHSRNRRFSVWYQSFIELYRNVFWNFTTGMRIGTSSSSIITFYMISTQRYRVCRLLERDESGRWNVRLANSVLPPIGDRNTSLEMLSRILHVQRQPACYNPTPAVNDNFTGHDGSNCVLGVSL